MNTAFVVIAMNDFEVIREQLPIDKAAAYLLGKPVRRMYFFPGEQTPSIRIYTNTRSFFDFGRCVGGDVIKLWSHVREVDSGQAVKEICEEFNISLDQPDKMEIARSIRRQEQARKQQEEEKKRRRKTWLLAVDRAKLELQATENVLKTARPLSDEWVFCLNRQQRLEYLLDYLCDVI